ncbi:MAG: ABC transporter ATP-binding protein [Burkholderiales bacterium]|nr:ABC transporter ATP-binding protein [Burkholderiales bacterium]
MSTQPFLKVEGLTKIFPARRGGKPVAAIKEVHFTIERGEFVCIIGHSGCGKSTILNILAGLDEATDGVVIMDGRQVSGPGLDRGVVFQGHALFPWLTVRENIEFAIKSRWPEWSKDKVRAHCQKYIDLVHLTGHEYKKPAELSGGMRQRVGIARAFSIEPKMLLLDEPFAALDALTRAMIQDELLSICAKTRQTVFMITHDVDEAIRLADKVLLMTNGPEARIAEIVVNTLPRSRTKHDVYKHPHYYRIRNHLIDFLVNRSRHSTMAAQPDYDGHSPPIVCPGLEADEEADGGRELVYPPRQTVPSVS